VDLVWLAGALVVLGVVWLVIIAGLHPHYLALFREHLKQGTIDTRAEIPELDLHTLEALLSALSSEDDFEVIAALDMFATYQRTRLIPALILYHPSRSVVLHAFELFADSKRQDLARLAARLLRHPDRDIRAAALRLYSASSPSESVLQSRLQDESHAVRATALVGLVAGGFLPAAEAASRLSALLERGPPEALEALALSFWQLPQGRFAWVAEALVTRRDPALLPLVARSMATSPHLDQIPMLIEMLAERDARGEARKALRKLGLPALDALERALDDLELSRRIRRHLPRTISAFGGEHAAAILTRRLSSEEDPAVAYKMLRGLGRLCAGDPSLPIDRPAIVSLAEHTLRQAITALSWRLAVEDIRRWRPRTKTPASELLVLLLRDHETKALERVFRLLHVLEPTEEFRIIYDALLSTDPRMRAYGRELLQNVAPDPLGQGILAMLDDVPDAERLALAASFYDPPGRAELSELARRLEGAQDREREELELEMLSVYSQCLQAMLTGSGEVLRKIASSHVAELGLGKLPEPLAAGAGRRESNLRALFEQSLRILNRPPELRGAR